MPTPTVPNLKHLNLLLAGVDLELNVTLGLLEQHPPETTPTRATAWRSGTTYGLEMFDQLVNLPPEKLRMVSAFAPIVANATISFRSRVARNHSGNLV